MMIISYPKSGRTWLKVLIERYCKVSSTKRPRIDSNHLGYGHGKEKSVSPEKDTLVLLTRDKSDTLVSLYHDDKVRYPKRVGGKSIDTYVKDMVPEINKFYTEIEKYPFAYTMSYENMSLNTFNEVLPFFELLFDEVNQDALREAIEFCKFDNLAVKERENKVDMRVPTKFKLKGFYKTRKGKVGSAKEELLPETIKYLGDNLL